MKVCGKGLSPRSSSRDRLKETAEAFCTCWDNVYTAVRSVVQYGLQHRSLDRIEAIGVDEVQWQRDHRYVTLVYQIDTGTRRLLYVGKGRTVRSLLGFFLKMGPEVTASRCCPYIPTPR